MRRRNIMLLVIIIVVVSVSALLPQFANPSNRGCLSETTLKALLENSASSEPLDVTIEVPMRDGTVYAVHYPGDWQNALAFGGDDDRDFAELRLGTSSDYILEGNEVIVLMTFYPRDSGTGKKALDEARISRISEDAVYVPFLPQFDSVIATCQTAYRQANIIVALNDRHYLRVDVQAFDDPMRYIGTIKAIISQIDA